MKITITLEPLPPATPNCPEVYRRKSDAERLESVATFHGYDSPAQMLDAMLHDMIGNFEEDLIFSPGGEIIGSQGAFVDLEHEIAALMDEMDNEE